MQDVSKNCKFFILFIIANYFARHQDAA